MNYQVNYIIRGFLICLSIALGLFVFTRINFITTSQNHSSIDEKKATVSTPVYDGQMLFMKKCASCHKMGQDLTGPDLTGISTRGPWSDKAKLYAWIRNPSVFMKNDPYVKALKKKYTSMMTSFPDITNQEVDAILLYINEYSPNIPIVRN